MGMLCGLIAPLVFNNCLLAREWRKFGVFEIMKGVVKLTQLVVPLLAIKARALGSIYLTA